MAEYNTTDERQEVVFFVNKTDRNPYIKHGVLHSLMSHRQYVILAVTLALILFVVFYVLSINSWEVDVQLTLEFGWLNKPTNNTLVTKSGQRT